jgi:hypothetical protein
MPDGLARRRSLMLTALVTAQMPDNVPEARMLRAWLDTWAGVGDIVTGVNRQGFDARLSQSSFGWRAEFCRKQVNDAEVGRPGGGAWAVARRPSTRRSIR